MIFAVRLPMPPSTNNMFVNVPKRGRASSEEYRDWKQSARRIVMRAWEAAARPKIGKPYKVKISLGLNRSGDIANREKALTDILVSTIPDFPDDRWIDHITIERRGGIPGAAVIQVMS